MYESDMKSFFPDIKKLILDRKLLENAHEVIFVFDEAGRILYANEAAKTELQYVTFKDRNITEIYPFVFHLVEGALACEEKQVDEGIHTFAYCENRTCYPVKLYCSQDELNGLPLQISYAWNDSERYEAVHKNDEAMKDVREAMRMKGEFTANITHELRTPINGIKGMTETLAQTQLTQEQAETVDIILHCCDNMTKIINDILDYSKIESGKIELEERQFSINDLLKKTLSMHMRKLSEKGLKLVVNISGNVPDNIIGDELRLGQIINNLVSNAIKFTESGKISVELSARRLDEETTELFVMVIDTGIGIDEHEKTKLFKSFSQVDGSVTRRFGGTGLGLAITKQLVELMGGTISVNSEKGKGSAFSFNVVVKNAPMSGLLTAFSPESLNISKLAEAGKSSSSEEPANEFTRPGEIPVNVESDGADITLEIFDLIEKLSICIELEGWDKAEAFATTLKGLVSTIKPEVKRKAFALLLNVRKANYEMSISLIEDIKEILK